MKFIIPTKMPSLNQVNNANRSHYFVGAKLKREIEDIIGWAIKDAVGKRELWAVTKYPCIVNVTFYEKNRKRDLDNIMSNNKFILDALQQFNILKGDGQKYVGELNNKVVSKAADWFVEVEILENE
ncbi:MAG: hypothetical protein FWD76_03790 [Firmicutes bacterium]|nr:hypothetical protein [Bacillota bacterium]